MKNEFLNKLLKINEPMGQKTYFKYSFCLILIQALLVLIFTGIYFTIKIPIQFILLLIAFLLIVEIPFLYIYYIFCTKRIWDITQDKFNAVWICAIAFILGLLKPLVFVLLFVILSLLPAARRQM